MRPCVTRKRRPTRRSLLQTALVAAAGFRGIGDRSAVARQTAGVADCADGLLIGGLLGDALGGPLEFSDSPQQVDWLCRARQWPETKELDDEELTRLESQLALLDYRTLRPQTAPYGPWRAAAPAGTVTDDSRHKMVLLRAIRTAVSARRAPTVADLARAYLAFTPSGNINPRHAAELNEEGFREYRYAARWVLGERDLRVARPLERLWAGVNNCSGQMLLPPLAVCCPGDPVAAYHAAFRLNFVDAPMARDMAAALVAGLAAVLGPELAAASVEHRWNVLLSAMRDTDPFEYQAVPFAGRQLHRWMNKAEELADRAAGRPQRLYELLETEGDPVFWWDAHFTLLVPLALLRLCDFRPLAALHLALDFGHDTDSYAQVIGCLAGAVCGAAVFPESMRQATANAVAEEYDEDVAEWRSVLQTAAGYF